MNDQPFDSELHDFRNQLIDKFLGGVSDVEIEVIWHQMQAAFAVERTQFDFPRSDLVLLIDSLPQLLWPSLMDEVINTEHGDMAMAVIRLVANADGAPFKRPPHHYLAVLAIKQLEQLDPRDPEAGIRNGRFLETVTFANLFSLFSDESVLKAAGLIIDALVKAIDKEKRRAAAKDTDFAVEDRREILRQYQAGDWKSKRQAALKISENFQAPGGGESSFEYVYRTILNATKDKKDRNEFIEEMRKRLPPAKK